MKLAYNETEDDRFEHLIQVIKIEKNGHII